MSKIIYVDFKTQQRTKVVDLDINESTVAEPDTEDAPHEESIPVGQLMQIIAGERYQVVQTIQKRVSQGELTESEANSLVSELKSLWQNS